MSTTTTDFLSSPEQAAASSAPAAAAAVQAARTAKSTPPRVAQKAPSLYVQYASTIAKLLAVLAVVWIVSVATYATVVAKNAPVVPAYAYVLVAILMAVPALSFLALSAGVKFTAQILSMLPALATRLQQTEAASRDITNNHSALAGALTSQLEESEQRAAALAAAVASLCNDYEARLANLRRDVALRPLATQVPPVHAPFVPSTPAVATTAEMIASDEDAANAQPMTAETEMENLILRHERHLFDGLHALSIELVRLTDAAASPDLWRRYMRGERDVFTADFAQRLSHGHTTAENYRSKDEFRRAVVRYIAQYETLRDRLARLDEANAVHDYIEQSAAGQVYNVLMQATSDYARAED